MSIFTAQQVRSWIQAGRKIERVEPAPKGAGRLLFKIQKDGGTPEWYYKYHRPEGKYPTRMKLGNANGEGALTIAQARRKAEEQRNLREQGLDPKTELEKQKREQEAHRRAQQARGSLQQLFDEYIEHLKASGKKSWPQVERALTTGKFAATTYFPSNIKAAEVTPQDIKQLLADTFSRGSKSMAHHLRSYLHSAFSYGMKFENDYTNGPTQVTFELTSNPVTAIPVDTRAARAGTRVLTPEEIASLWTEFPHTEIHLQTLRALQLIVCSGGQRVKEIVEAKIDEFDLNAGIWTIPVERSKNDQAHQVILSSRAVELIQAASSSHDSPFLFPNRNHNDRPMTFTSLCHAVSRYCKRNEIPRWTPRDIRRTARTMLAEAGVPAEQLDFFLNHGTNAGVGQRHYDRSVRLDMKRNILEKWEGILSEVIQNASIERTVVSSISRVGHLGAST